MPNGDLSPALKDRLFRRSPVITPSDFRDGFTAFVLNDVAPDLGKDRRGFASRVSNLVMCDDIATASQGRQINSFAEAIRKVGTLPEHRQLAQACFA